jgi:hypothetical protein
LQIPDREGGEHPAGRRILHLEVLFVEGEVNRHDAKSARKDIQEGTWLAFGSLAYLLLCIVQ